MLTALSTEEARLLFPGAARTDLTKVISWLYTAFVVVAHMLLSPLLLTGPRPSAQVGNGHLLCNPEPNLSSHILVHRHVYHQFREQEMPVPFRFSNGSVG